MSSKGAYPSRLYALVPEYLDEMPEDTFSGYAPRYFRTTEGFLLYSVGENMTDDGGRDRKADGDDIVVQVPPK